ncbi:hypothetical protein FRB93_007032 [Tulasnella sp. JGI-2019a]|nr:hypothetical protein FRB93_007032 [Tulasnella sp. JGI-2019a]
MKWYHEPASPANGHHETIIILGADGELDTPIYAGSGVSLTHAGLGLKHPAMTHESIFVVGLMLLLLFITAKASSDISTKAHMVDAVEDSFSVPPRNSIEGVDFSRLARHAGRPSSHAVVRFNGSFSTGDGFIKARLEISAHPRRPSVWWLVATASDDSRVLANLTFGAGANMTYEPNGLVEIETTDSCVHKSTMAAPICLPPSSDPHPSPTSHFHHLLPLPPDFLLLPYLPEETSNIAPEVKMPNPALADDMEVTLTHVTPLPINPSCDVIMIEQPDDAATIAIRLRIPSWSMCPRLSTSEWQMY